jgi:hypothetical protein
MRTSTLSKFITNPITPSYVIRSHSTASIARCVSSLVIHTSIDALISEKSGIPRKLVVLDLNGTLLLREQPVFSTSRPERGHYSGRRFPRAGHTPEHHGSSADEEPRQRSSPYLSNKFAFSSMLGRRGGNTNSRPYSSGPGARDSKPPAFRKILLRPYMLAFKSYLFHPQTLQWLDTMIWSSAQPHNVGAMVEAAFGSETHPSLKAVWARDTLIPVSDESNYSMLHCNLHGNNLTLASQR